MRTSLKSALILFFSCCVCAVALAPPQKPITAIVPTLTFTFDHPELDTPHYVVTVDSTCHGSFTDSPPTIGETRTQLEESSLVQFKLSASTCSHLFDLLRALNYLTGNFDYTKQRVAFTGKKTITYVDSDHNTTTTLNWSENSKMMDMVETFEGIAGTLLLGRRLNHLYKYQILGLDQELAKAEGMAHDGFLKELSLIEGPLKTIAEDNKVVNVARQRARRLLYLAKG